MRIRQLDLQAFGNFTDRVLEFGADGTGLHIISGANEAGKSTALRALHALLYGVPGNTRDNFLHKNPQLRIGGQLLDEQGQSLEFVRRKGNKNTLLDRQGDSLPDDTLSPWLGGVPRELFESLFGIDHAALIRGGQEILDQHGELGQALFSAASAARGLHRMLGDLDGRAAELFKPGGQNPRINQAIREYRELQAEQRRCSLSASDWTEKFKQFDNTRKELAVIKQRLLEARSCYEELQRFRKLLPRFAERREILQNLAALDGVTELAADFSQRRRKVETDLQTSRDKLSFTREQADQLEKKIQSIELDETLLDKAADIEQLYAMLPVYRKTDTELPGLRKQLEDKTAALEAMLDRIQSGLTIERHHGSFAGISRA
ncbi:MAG: AAA family ATPase [Gammaproteobacteria bacterium]|nr:AAA family ATPase [Gammaproteobacteria bacterium]